MYRVIYADGQTSENFDSKNDAQQHIEAMDERGAHIQVLEGCDWMLCTTWIPS